MEVTRKGFIKILLTFSSVAVIGEGCGDDTAATGGEGGSSSATGTTGTGASTSTGGKTGCGATGTAIAGNHGHVLVIPEADLSSAADKTYSMMGTATHDHMITFTAANLAALKAMTPVMVTSAMGAMHTHVVTATCV